MPDSYFSRFPLINYANTTAIDITRRAYIDSATLNNSFLFYPVVQDRAERSDQFARRVFGDPYQEYITFLTNGIISPYDSAYMSPNEFNDYILQKYGSLTSPQQKVKYYVNNWSLYPGAIDLSTFDALDISLQKYYQPLYNGYGSIYAYTRIQADWTINTNHLVSYTFANTIPQFIDDEIVVVNFQSNATGNAQVLSCSNNVLNLHHVIGYYLPVNNAINAVGFSITGTQSNSVITISTNNAVSFQPYDSVPAVEQVYYSPVYQYTDEYNLNETKKILQVMQNSYVQTLSKNLTKTLNS